MNNTENNIQEADVKTNEPKNKEKEEKETEQHEKEWITVSTKVERKQQNNNNKESNRSPYEISQHEEENEDSNNENFNDKMVVPYAVHFKTETKKGEMNSNKKHYQVKMKKNKKVRNDSAMIKETNIKAIADHFKKGPEALDLETNHVACDKNLCCQTL